MGFSFATGFSTMSEIIKSATYHFNTKNDLIQVRYLYNTVINNESTRTLRFRCARFQIYYYKRPFCDRLRNNNYFFPPHSYGSFTKTNKNI